MINWITPRIGITPTIPMLEEGLTIINLSTNVEPNMAAHFPMIMGDVAIEHLDFLSNWINHFLTKKIGRIVFYSPKMDAAGLLVGWYFIRHRKKVFTDAYQAVIDKCPMELTTDWIKIIPVPVIGQDK